MNESNSYPPAAHLSDRSKKIWASVVPSTGKLPPRLALVTTALEALDRADGARKILDDEGVVVTPPNGKMAHAHPAIRIEKDSRAQFLKAWSQLKLHWDRPDLKAS